MDNSKEIGKIGERFAIRFLIKKNYHIIEKNYNCNFGEIDIIAYDNNRKEIVFIEVKTRTNNNYGTGISSIDITKQKHIYKTSEYYMYTRNMMMTNARIDAIEVWINKDKISFKHYKNIIYEKPYYKKRI